MLKLKLQYFGHHVQRVDSLEKILMLGGIGGRRRRGRQDEMAGWHHWLDAREFEWTPGVGDGQGGLACCDSRGHKEWDTTEWLNWTEQRGWDGGGEGCASRGTLSWRAGATAVSTLTVMLCCSGPSCCRWLARVRGSLCIISYNWMWIYKYRKIKSLAKKPKGLLQWRSLGFLQWARHMGFLQCLLIWWVM